MENAATIDLFTPSFWIMVAIAFAVMIPLVGVNARRIAFALINLGFLGYYLRADLVAVICGLLVISLVLGRVQAGKFAAAWLWLGGIVVLGIFLVHKRPAWGAPFGLGRWHPLLTTIGYSYFALRLIDVARGVAEGRHRAPSLFELIDYLLPFHMLSADRSNPTMSS